MHVSMFRCKVCGSLGLTPGVCGVCGGSVSEYHETSSGHLTLTSQRSQSFWTLAKIAATIAVVLVVVSSVGAGLYLSSRPSSPSCSNGALNYPSCNTCASSETYTSECVCTDGAVNGPKCNRWCANNAINPPTGAGSRGCDQCADGRIVDQTGPCPPAERIIERPHELLRDSVQNKTNTPALF